MPAHPSLTASVWTLSTPTRGTAWSSRRGIRAALRLCLPIRIVQPDLHRWTGDLRCCSGSRASCSGWVVLSHVVGGSPARCADHARKWSWIDETTVVGTITAASDFQIVLETYIPLAGTSRG